MNAVLDFAKRTNFSRLGPFMTFAKPVSLLRLVLVTVFFFIQWNCYAFVIDLLGGTHIINTALSLAAALFITYKLFPFLKAAPRTEDDK